MNRTHKEENIAELRETLGRVASLMVADYRGLTVEQVNDLRHEMRKADCHYRVVKNTLFKRAIAGTEMEHIGDLFKGPTAIAYSFDDPMAPAKILDRMAEALERLQVKGGYLDGEVLAPAGVKSVATMKGKDELRAELLATFIAPAQSFLRLLQAGPQNFLYLLAARERAAGQQ